MWKSPQTDKINMKEAIQQVAYAHIPPLSYCSATTAIPSPWACLASSAWHTICISSPAYLNSVQYFHKMLNVWKADLQVEFYDKDF